MPAGRLTLDKEILKVMLLALAAIWVGIISRSLLPLDETRYVTVAWNMWLNGNWLVPMLNGQTYSHKPPLLFWLINAGWHLFGVQEWWPRLVPALFALANILLTWRLARKLWPGREQEPLLAATLLVGCALWPVLSTAVMFDMMVTFFTLLGMNALVAHAQNRQLRSLAWLGIAIGGGLLAKGPTILLQLLPAACLAPWWRIKPSNESWTPWYRDILLALLIGVLLALAWAIPAVQRGGPEYGQAIFWGQTAGRLVHSFAHRQPIWWYLLWLPLMLFPWLIWPRALRALGSVGHHLKEPGIRFTIAWTIPVLVGFSLISGKQAHYLLPIFPGFCLLLARLLTLHDHPSTISRPWPVAIVIFALAAAILSFPIWPQGVALVRWLAPYSLLTGMLVAILGLLTLVYHAAKPLPQAQRLCVFSTVLIMTLYVAIMRGAGGAYDLHPVSQRLHELESTGTPLAIIGKNHGQFQFLGRMLKPLESVQYSALGDWFNRHPDGKVVVIHGSKNSLANIQPDFGQSYMGDRVAILGKAQWLMAQSQKGWTLPRQPTEDESSDQE